MGGGDIDIVPFVDRLGNKFDFAMGIDFMVCVCVCVCDENDTTLKSSCSR